jgi:LPS sulfotransferase NodH
MFDSYIICTSPRSGSTLLCNLLASSNVSGKPDSYYHREMFMREWAEEWGIPVDDTLSKKEFDAAYLSAAIKAGKAGTSVFGLRLQRDYLGLLSGTLDTLFPGLPSDVARFEKAFGKVLYLNLKRTDKVAQAISLIKAELSGLWHIAPDGTEIERLSAPKELRYDFDHIRHTVSELEAADRSWDTWFEQQRINPMRLDYDKLSVDPAGVVVDICRALGVKEPDRRSIAPGLGKLSDDLSTDWIRRYKLESDRP